MQMSKAKAEPKALPKRFYAAVALQQNESGWVILLDGKSVKTFAKKLLQVSSQQLAEAIAEEWRAQQTVINPDTMPLTRLANITIDRLAEDRAALLNGICDYAETDLIAYRDTQANLRARQDAAFAPVLTWLKQHHQIIVAVTDSVLPIVQPETASAALKTLFAAASDAELAALAMMVPLLGSAYLALAIWQGAISVEEAMAASCLEETFQAERWGEDEEQQRLRENKGRDVRAAAFFLTCSALN